MIRHEKMTHINFIWVYYFPCGNMCCTTLIPNWCRNSSHNFFFTSPAGSWGFFQVSGNWGWVFICLLRQIRPECTWSEDANERVINKDVIPRLHHWERCHLPIHGVTNQLNSLTDDVLYQEVHNELNAEPHYPQETAHPYNLNTVDCLDQKEAHSFLCKTFLQL